MKKTRAAVVVILLAALGSLNAACSSSGGSAQQVPAESNTKASFVNKVWRVSESPAVAPGTLYVFLSEGTLLITSEHSKPALGSWKHDGEVLTMVEESIAYKVETLSLTGDKFRIRSHNPGGSVEILLVPAGES